MAKVKAIREKMAESELKKLEENGAGVPGWQKYASKANLHIKADQPGADIERDISANGSVVGLTTGGNSAADGTNEGGVGAGAGTGAGRGTTSSTPAVAGSSGGGGGGNGAPYPEQFQAIIEAVTTGKPIAGVKEIPDTVLRPSVSP